MPLTQRTGNKVQIEALPCDIGGLFDEVCAFSTGWSQVL